MQKCGNKWPVGVCSWSFRKSIDEIGSVMTALGLEHINLAIAEGRTPSLAFNHFAWFGIESAQCALGNKPEYQQLP